MYGMVRTPRRLVLALALVLAMVGISAAAGPAAFAASPSITASSPGDNAITTIGSNFTWGGQVVVEVFDSHYNLADWRYTTASYGHCSLTFCFLGGMIDVGMNVAPCWQTDHVIAYDYATGSWSNWSNIWVQCVG